MSEVFCGTTQISNVNFSSLTEDTSELKVFQIQLSSYYNLVPQLSEYLNAAELQRARKYHFEKDNNQFIITRSLLKFILAQHSSVPVSEINIEIDKNRKPHLASNPSVCFNVTHAKDYALILVRDNNAVGIDVEFLNNDFDYSEMLKDIYSSQEIETVLNATDKTHAFFKYWTRKEAIVKTTGTGISDFLPQIPAIDGHHEVPSRFLDGYKSIQILSFDLNKEYIASIALSGKSIDFNEFIIYNLPNTIEGLISFSS